MFLTTGLTGQVPGARRAKGKRKGWREEMVFSSAALGTEKCQAGEAGAAGRGVCSWVLLPWNSWEWVGWVMEVTGVPWQQ